MAVVGSLYTFQQQLSASLERGELESLCAPFVLNELQLGFDITLFHRRDAHVLSTAAAAVTSHDTNVLIVCSESALSHKQTNVSDKMDETCREFAENELKPMDSF